MRMWHLAPSLLVLVIIGLAWTAELSTASNIQLSPETGNYESSSSFTIQNGYYRSDNTLYVSSPPSLRDYYTGKSHTITSEQDYAKFVTPEAVISIAKNIRNITQNTNYEDEEFANAVLTIVHGIPYVKSPAKYPVETIIDNSADCDGLSILAASIMKAGGLDVVLLLYKGISPTHMNIGVHLEHMPVSNSWWIAPSGIEYNNKTYWIAECTALADWTVGNQPEILANDKPVIILLQNSENKSSLSLSSSLNKPLQVSSASIRLSIGNSNESNDLRAINISGSISPFFYGEKVVVYINQHGYSSTAYTPIVDQFGNYTLTWNVTSFGTYNVRASCSGFADYSGSDSETLTVFVNAKQSSNMASPTYFWDTSPSQAYSPEFLALLSMKNTEFLNGSLTGKDVILSGEFMVLSNGQDEPANDTTIIIPAHQQIFRWPRSRRTTIMNMPEETITIPGIRNQFGFILERTAEDNYTASVKLLTDNDILQMTGSLNQSGSMFMNASLLTARNEWNKAITKISEDSVSIELYNDNGTRLQNMASSTAITSFEELGIFMTYGPSQVLAFKNLKVEATTQNQVAVGDEKVKENGIEVLYSLLRISFLLAGVALAVVALKARRKNGVFSSNPGKKSN